MTRADHKRRKSWILMLSIITTFGLLAAACGSDDDDSNTTATTAAPDDGDTATTAAPDDGSTDTTEAPDDGAMEDRSITVALVGNDNIEKMAELAPANFTAETGIEVNFTVLDEQTLREVTTRDVGAGGEQFDVVQIGMYETPQFGANGWLVRLNDLAAASDTYDIDDLIPAVRNGLSVDGELYASPFYAESSFVMYRSDIIDNMPDAPTWERSRQSLARSTPMKWPASASVESLAGATLAPPSPPCSTPSVAPGGKPTLTAPSALHRLISQSSPKR